MKKYSFLIVCMTVLIALFAISCTTEPDNMVSVKDTAELKAAIEDGTKPIRLDNDIAATERFAIKDKSISIDFNGHKITLSDSFADAGSGPYGLITIDNEGDLTLKDSSNGNGGIDVASKSNAKVSSCIIIYPDNGHKAKLTVEGGSYKATDFAISGNGTCTDENCTEINISGGSFEGATAIYHPQNGIMRITGGEFKGTDTAVEIRAGKINIADGKFISTSDAYTCKPDGNGSTTVGSAIAIAQHTTKLPITVGIDGGEFSGYHAISEDNPQNNDSASLSTIQLQIDNGSFKSTNTADDKAAVYSKDLSKFISGGTFNTVPSPAGKEYTADDTSIEHVSGSDIWTVTSI